MRTHPSPAPMHLSCVGEPVGLCLPACACLPVDGHPYSKRLSDGHPYSKRLMTRQQWHDSPGARGFAPVDPVLCLPVLACGHPYSKRFSCASLDDPSRACLPACACLSVLVCMGPSSSGRVLRDEEGRWARGHQEVRPITTALLLLVVGRGGGCCCC